MVTENDEMRYRRRWTKGAALLLALCLAGWIGLTYVTIEAVHALGLQAATTIFAEDMGHPWRAQFNTDLVLNCALIGAWIIFRTRSLSLGILLALLTINGALFNFAYVFFVTLMARGNLNRVALGWRATT